MTPIKNTIVLIALSLFITGSDFAQEIVTAKDGRKVRLNADKTWEYLSAKSSPGSSLSKRSLSQKSLTKQEKKARIKKLRKARKEYYADIKKTEVNAEHLAQFPQNYVERNIRIKGVFLGKMESSAPDDDGTRYYYYAVRSGAMYIHYLPGAFFFFSDEKTAQKSFAMYNRAKNENWFREEGTNANIFGKVYRFGNRIGVRIICVEYLDYLGGKYGFSPGCPSFLSEK